MPCPSMQWLQLVEPDYSRMRVSATTGVVIRAVPNA